MSELDYAVHRLTEPWPYILLGKKAPDGVKFVTEMDPLLDILKEMRGSSLGVGNDGGGVGIFRVPLNMEAMTLWEGIDASVNSWCLDLGHLAHGDLKDRMRQLGQHIETAHRTQIVDDGRYQHLVDMVKRWADQIMEQIEGWHDREYKVPCPNCHQTRCENPLDGSEQWALHLRYRDASWKAECRRCKHHWDGVKEVLTFLWLIGATGADSQVTQVLNQLAAEQGLKFKTRGETETTPV